jgi:dynein heavy chain
MQQYYKAMGILTPIESKLLALHVKKLQQVLDPGFSHFNWNSLGILDFLTVCMKAINEFKSLVNQVSFLKILLLNR